LPGRGAAVGEQPKLNQRQQEHLIAVLHCGECSTAELADLFAMARSTAYRAQATGERPARDERPPARSPPKVTVTPRADVLSRTRERDFCPAGVPALEARRHAPLTRGTESVQL